jgi:anti-sigma B factor antagonist
MRIETRRGPEALIAAVAESRIDAASAIQFKDAMREAAGAEPGRVVLDLSQVDFIDSSGLGAIVAVMKMLAPERKLDLAAPTPNVERVLRLTRMDSVFTVHADADAGAAMPAAAG